MPSKDFSAVMQWKVEGNLAFCGICPEQRWYRPGYWFRLIALFQAQRPRVFPFAHWCGSWCTPVCRRRRSLTMPAVDNRQRSRRFWRMRGRLIACVCHDSLLSYWYRSQTRTKGRECMHIQSTAFRWCSFVQMMLEWIVTGFRLMAGVVGEK